jgi:hypothetical protein
MHRRAVSPPLPRPPDNEFYDRGCDLVAAAVAIRELAGEPGARQAAPAVLGCFEAALHELSGACAALEETIERATQVRQRAATTPRLDAVAQRTRRGFSNLELALCDAQGAAIAARSLAASSLGG